MPYRFWGLKIFTSHRSVSKIFSERLQESGVADWAIWEKEISQFPIDFDETETAYILEGEILVTPEGGEPVRILPGDLVVFHEGLNSQWEVVKPLRKHYSYD
ncbi:MAG: cupin domain-containing protein [Methylosarcina sp.]